MKYSNSLGVFTINILINLLQNIMVEKNLRKCLSVIIFSLFLFQDPLVHLPEDMITKVYGIFAVVFQYAVDILTWEKENELPPGLETA